MEKTVNVSHSESISTTEALWALIVRQNKRVQKDLARRLLALIHNDSKTSQQAYVKDTMNSALTEVRQAHESGRVLPDAKSLFDNIDD